MVNPIIGVIGGTGLGEAISRDSTGETIEVDTPFGKPSSPITKTIWQGLETVFMTRHGEGHMLPPSNVPYRANIYALKKLGVTHIIASGATGSLQQHIKPGDLVIPDQIIDKTFRRDNTFFDNNIAVHVEFAYPFCNSLRQALLRCGNELDTQIHDGGVYVCMEGPQFSTVAESHLHRSWGGDLIGMTCMPEARLAREAEICYALVALPTDYDCWQPHDSGKDQTALLEVIMGNLTTATQNAVRLIQATLSESAGEFAKNCSCRDSLKLGIWSDKEKLDKSKLAPLEPLLQKYITFDD